MLKIQRTANGDVVLTVSGRLQADNVSELSALLAVEQDGRTRVLDPKALVLVDSDAVRFLCACVNDSIVLRNCPPISFATFQHDLVAATLQQVAGWVFLPKGEVLETNLPGTHSIGVRRPLGVVASFTPWNGANVLSWRAVISPVAAGNTVVVKPSEFASVSAGVMLAEVAEEAGFPAGVINVVTHAPGAAGGGGGG